MNAHNLLLSPPLAFVIILAAMLFFSDLLSRLSYKGGSHAKDAGKSYACGEDAPSNLIQPEYGDFFPFAFFFTILHVVALMIATFPVKTTATMAIALIYITGAIAGLFILFRR